MIIEVNNLPFKAGKSVVGIDEEDQIITRFRVAPNPFTYETTISFVPALDALYELELYNLLGVKVKSLYDRSLRKGEEVILPFRSKNLDEGIYMLVLKTEYGRETRKLIIAR